MAEDGPIIIPSDDDDDDVVIIKEEIEVDSEDCIFLSETKAPPKPEIKDADSSTSANNDTNVSTSGTLTLPTSLHRSTSVTTCTERLSLDENSETDLSCNSSNIAGSNGVPAPLDLSAKSSEDSPIKGCNSDLTQPFSLDLTNQNDSGAFASGLINQNSTDPFASMFNTSVSDCFSSTVSKLNDTFNSFLGSAAFASWPGTLSDFGPQTSNSQITCDKTSVSMTNVSMPTCSNDDKAKSQFNLKSNQDPVKSVPLCKPNDLMPYPTVTQTLTSNTLQTNPGCSHTVIASAPLFVPAHATIADTFLNSIISSTATTSVYSLPGLSTISLSAPWSGNKGNNSLFPQNRSDNSLTPNSKGDDSILPQATSVIVNSTSTNSNSTTASQVNNLADDTSKIPGNSHTVSAILGGKQTQKSSIPVPTIKCSDPFATSHMLLSALDPMWSPMMSQSKTNPQTYSGSSVIQSVVSSNIGTQSSSLVSQSGLFKTITTAAQSTNCIMGLPGGASSSAPQFHTSNNNMNCSSSSSSSILTNNAQNVVSSTRVDTLIDDWKKSYAKYKDILYNPLTLPVSMQHKPLKLSTSLTSLSGANISANPSGNRKSSYPRSPSPHGSHALPPKKQRRCFSDASLDGYCVNCMAFLTGEKFSRCPAGHSTCSKCLEEKVKLVLTGKVKESIKCLKQTCGSLYPVSELKLSLPSMVVEILEDKLVDYISDMILKNASSDTDSAMQSTSMDTDESREITDEIKLKKNENQSTKYPDCPENWDQMDENEKIVSKNGYIMVELEPGCAEYEDVVCRFFQSMVDHNVEVTSVRRVQNPIQWKYYTVKKTEMLQDNEGFGGVEEQQLFHGTNSTVVDAICRKGFDWRLCGKHGTMYGQGSYFAKCAAYSHQYTDLKPSHRLIRSTMSMPNALSSSLSMNHIPPPMFLFPPANPTITQPLSQMNPVMNPQPFLQSNNNNNFPALNLSHNAPSVSINSSTGSSIGIGSQLQHSLAGSSSPQLGNQSNPHQAHGCNFSSFSGNQASPFQKFKVNPKPAGYRTISGLASSALTAGPSHMDRSDRSTAKIFLARVLVGKYVGGTNKLRKPPPLYPKQDPYGKCYDSCVDDIMNPKIFVIFDSAQAYPEYLLEYSSACD